ncbi:MAG: glycosyltransferase family 4 protein [Patescibacteria group bacterium]
MIKITQLNSHSGIGGGERVMFDIVKGLKYNFKFSIMAPSGVFLEKYSQLEIEIEKLKKQNFIKNIFQIKNFVKNKQPDIIHVHGTRAAFWARIAIIGLKKRPKIIYTLHGFHIIRKYFLIRWILLVIERFLNRWTDVLVCVSEADKNLVLKYKTISQDKIVVINNSIDIIKFQINQDLIESLKQKLSLENQFIITTIARLHPPKDILTILKAVKLLINKISDIKLLIVGDGPLRESLEQETKKLGLEQCVKFLGSREDVPVLINLSDIIVLSTKWEGLPLAPLEAGACKKSIIASDVEGVRETIINKKTGYLFQPGSEKDLAEKILKLAESKELRKKIGENAFKFISVNFDEKIMINKHQKLYQSLT